MAKVFRGMRQFGQKLIGPRKSVTPRNRGETARHQMRLVGRQRVTAAAPQQIGKMIELSLVHALAL
jgi:hypothetical protein